MDDLFGDLLMACHTSTFRYARALCHDPNEAEELVQETIRRALSSRKRPSPLTLEALRPWLFTILRNHWLNALRHKRSEADFDWDTGVPVTETPESILTRRYLQSEVRDALDALPPAYREVIVLREMEGLSYQEISSLLGCPPGTVMSRLARARTRLRGMFVGLSRTSPGTAAGNPGRR